MRHDKTYRLILLVADFVNGVGIGFFLLADNHSNAERVAPPSMGALERGLTPLWPGDGIYGAAALTTEAVPSPIVDKSP